MKTARLLPAVIAGTALAFSIISSSSASAATVPAITAFDETFSKINDYTVTVRAHETKGDRLQDRTYHYWFKKPNMAKTEIVAGDGAGSGGVWKGGDTVKGHLKVAFMTFARTVNVHDGKATSLRGYTIPDGLLQNEVDNYKEVKGDLTQRTGPAIDGVPTEEVDLKVADPSANGGVTRMSIFLSKETHFPLRQVRWEGDKIVTDATFLDLKTNVGLSDSDFPF